MVCVVNVARVIIIIIQQVPIEFPLQLNWRRGPDMPFGMGDHVQSVVVEGTVYVGGGYVGSDNIMTYDISTGIWATLPQYRVLGFAMTTINNQLVLVGGNEHGGGRIKVVGVWDADNKQWTHPYSEMHTARAWCSVVVHNEWLVVAGGRSASGATLSSVEVMNTNSKQWYAGPPTPIPWDSMKTATVGDECYFMGGDSGSSTNTVYSVSLSSLTTGLTSKGKIWKEISGLQTTNSTPLSISGSVLAVGGRDKDRKTVTAIHLYQPDTGEWLKVGDLLTPRCDCTCAMIADREMVVAGGVGSQKRMDISSIKINEH